MAGKQILLAAALLQGVLSVPFGNLEERQSCGSQWSQCGGIGWTGATCCASGSSCVRQNDYYYQCLPGASPAPTTTTSQPGPTSSTTRGPSTSTQATTTTGGGGGTPTTTGGGGGGAGTTASFTGNPFRGVNLWANDYYASEISTLAMPSLSGAMATAAAAVAKVPSFEWLDIAAKVGTRMPHSLNAIRAANKAGGNYAAQFVVYNLPDRDCAAKASNGELSIADGGVAKYKAYIDSIREQLVSFSDIRTILVIEPDSLANMVTNLNVPKCANARAAYLECTLYAVKQLNLPNVAMYLDGGHAGWLGWPANLQPAADLFGKLYNDAGKPSQLRGMATNVANYNSWNLTSPPSYTSGNPNYDERHYVEAFRPLLAAKGWEAYFITDQGRSGKQPTGQTEWGHWCNAMGTGFGRRPTANTGLEAQDAFVWIKPGGECDGTSDTSAARYDSFCGMADALKPAPEAGRWFQAYFVQLLTNANPPF